VFPEKDLRHIIMSKAQEHTPQSPIEQFNALLETKLPEIMRGEDANTATIHLYRTGGYWAAFEKSAYLLSQTGMPHYTSAIQLPSRPTPIVVAYTDDITLAMLQQTHHTPHNSHDYKAIVSSPLAAELYEEWHDEETEMFFEE